MTTVLEAPPVVVTPRTGGPMNYLPIATIIVTVIVAIVGGVVTIINPSTLSFSSYIQDVAIGGGLLALGRGHDQITRP